MTRTRSLTWTLAAMLAVLVLSGAGAEAADLRSWDQKISNVGQRFVVLSAFNNEAVLDKETQLVWQRTPAEPSDLSHNHVSQHTAKLYCTGMATGGRMGWRLPTVHELLSLIAPAPGSHVLPAGHPFLNVVEAHLSTEYYWTSTQVLAQGSIGGYTVRFGGNLPYNAMSVDDPTVGHRYWCVRGPGAETSGL